MKITFELSDKIVQSYLNEYNDRHGTSFDVTRNLTSVQEKHIHDAFADLASCEIQMRTDDHDGFDTPAYFVDGNNIDLKDAK